LIDKEIINYESLLIDLVSMFKPDDP